MFQDESFVAGATALIATVSDAIARLLLEAGADVNAADTQGRTALMHAAADGDLGKVQVLLQAHADATLETQGGRTALDLARGGLKSARQNLKREAFRKIEERLSAGGNRGPLP